MRVSILDFNNHLKFQTIFDSFFEHNIWTDEAPDFIVDFNELIHGDRIIRLTPGRELAEIYEYLETLTPSQTEWGTLLGVRPLKLVHSLIDQGWETEAIKQHLARNILLQPQKIELLFETLKHQQAIYRSDRDKLSLFLSIPFCPSICSYCNFHTKPYQKRLARDYVTVLLQGLKQLGDHLRADERVVDVVYLGGGTPTALPPELLGELISAIDTIIPRSEVKEFTIEAGRIDTFSDRHIEILETVDRICINPQTFNERVLQGVNRAHIHQTGELIRHFEDRGVIVNSDLIAGLPGESVASFLDSLDRLIDLRPSNITVHNLSQKRGSALRDQPLSESGVRAMLRGGYQALRAAGYHPYYLYRQKNMLSHGENVGYERDTTACIYNIRMMEDAHEIISLGSNAVSKRIDKTGLRRIQSIKETTLFMVETQRWQEDLASFFQSKEAK
ncbi:MAG TPA: coproporphyrinogen dehydrogenase HemZ [Tissierellia bacterium]|nr:coproporphyrinogen dehydrogenase HemZ [Tissierellia bacterium]